MELKLKCFSCGFDNRVVDRVGRRDECSQCHADLHVCKNCQFYDGTAYNGCKEVAADVVREKEESNFCDFFEIGSGQFKKSEKEDLLAKAEALFKKS
jgi:hypothetical protein